MICKRAFSKVPFNGTINSTFTNQLQFINHHLPIPTFRVMNPENGSPDKSHHKIDKDVLLRWYRCMLQLNEFDRVMYDAQRQGRISFYMTNTGEEGLQIASAAGLNDNDMVFSQYREAGVLLYRGYPMRDMVNQCFGNVHDRGKGRQMPVHYGSVQHNFMTISSPLATQIPQAAGAAYAFKRNEENRCAIAYFGEGAASEGDFHAGLNMAATLSCPVIFFCRNNGYAISTPSEEQYRGDGIATRGASYGIHTIRVDGNDVLAVNVAVKEARKLAIKGNPVLIEAMTYRVGHHSTSDDSSAYRSGAELEGWNDSLGPFNRFRALLVSKGWWDEEIEAKERNQVRANVIALLNEAEKQSIPDYKENVFTDVYDGLPGYLKEQQEEMIKHVEKYKQHYLNKN